MIKLLIVALICGVCSVAHSFNYGKIMCVGDSLTASGTYNVTYRQDLFYDLNAHNDTFNFVGPNSYGNFVGDTNNQNVCAAYGGWTAQNLLQGNPSNTAPGDIINWLSTYQPDTVILMCGTNDFYALDSVVYTYTWDASCDAALNSIMTPRYNGLLTAIFNQNPDMRVIFMAPPKVLNGFDYGMFYSYAQHLKPFILNLVSEWASLGYKIRFADLWTFVSDTIGVDIGADGIHWIQPGGQIAASYVYAAAQTFAQTVNATVVLNNDSQPLPATLNFIVSNNEVAYDILGTLQSDGSYLMSVPDDPGYYNISLKYQSWLNQSVACLLSDNITTYINFNLINGDVDGDNAVTILDYAILSDYFDYDNTLLNWNTIGFDGYSPSDADLDKDGSVTILDYAILSDNFGLIGD